MRAYNKPMVAVGNVVVQIENGIATMAELLGHTMDDVEADGDTMVFLSGEQAWVFFHEDDCCESVGIEDIVGDVADLVGSPILRSEEADSSDAPEPQGADSYTWTYYKFATVKGDVDVRWLGTSNGYYSEAVTMSQAKVVRRFSGPMASQAARLWACLNYAVPMRGRTEDELVTVDLLLEQGLVKIKERDGERILYRLTPPL